MAEAIDGLLADSEAGLLHPSYVVIQSPKPGRRRFPESCVQVFPTESEARAGANAAEGRCAAVAAGPSRSSEGYRLYYLVRWLD